jgi:hypothetical protein
MQLSFSVIVVESVVVKDYVVGRFVLASWVHVLFLGIVSQKIIFL